MLVEERGGTVLVEQWNSVVEQWNSDGRTMRWNRRTVLVEHS